MTSLASLPLAAGLANRRRAPGWRSTVALTRAVASPGGHGIGIGSVAGSAMPPRRRVAAAASVAPPSAVTSTSKPGLSLTLWLMRQEIEGTIDSELLATLSSIVVACKKIAALVRTSAITGLTGYAEETGPNQSGDAVKKLDVIANTIFCDAVKDSGKTGILVSEEEDAPVAIEQSSEGSYIVCFDPIDGSSNLDAAVTTGSIFGIYNPPGECNVEGLDTSEAVRKCVVNACQSGDQMVCAGYCMFSSSVILVLTVGKGVYGFTFDPMDGEFLLTNPEMKIPDPGQKIYSVNQGNSDLWDQSFREYITQLQRPVDGSKPYAFRYIGALVGDFHRTLMYGGLWLYPPDSKAPEGKARLLYEVAPMAFLAEQAGGLATRGKLADERVMDVVPTGVHQRSPLFTGSKTAIKALQQFMSLYQFGFNKGGSDDHE